MINSLFSKILLSHVAVLLITTISIGLLLSHLIANFLIDDKKEELIREGSATVQMLDTAMQNQALSGNLLPSLSNLSGTMLWIADKDNNLISGQAPRRWHRQMQRHHKMNNHQTDPKQMISDDFFTGEINARVYKQRNDDDPSIIVAVPFPSNPNTALFLYTSINGISATSTAIQKLLLTAIICAVFFAILSAFFLSRSLTRPIRDISQTAKEFASGNYACRTSACGEDEIGKLGQTFNHMATVLARIEQNRREFFADITHELKTPIASIQAVTESIIDGVVSDEPSRIRYLQTILAQTTHMNSLICDLLDLERLESGQFQINYESCNIADFFNKLQDKYHSLLTEKDLCLKIDQNDDCITIETDIMHLEQILSNLLSNAIRHSFANTTIQISISKKNDDIIFTVTNHGEGIATKDLPYLCERFYRADKSRARNKGGTGLGLSITKKLTEEMNGSIAIDSVLNKETTFTIALPAINKQAYFK